MADREETMRERKIRWCPDWCDQNDEEHDYEIHFGPWTYAVDSGGPDNNVDVAARPTRGWTELGDSEDSSDANVQIMVAGKGAEPWLPDPDKALARMWLTPDDVESLIDGLTVARNEAELSGVGWKESYEGARDDEDEETI